MSLLGGLLATPLDTIAFIVFLLAFPVYHSVYPLIVRAMPGRTAKGRFDRLRRSWIRRAVEERDTLTAIHQVRNLTMMNSFLASAALILLGVTVNTMVEFPALDLDSLPHPLGWELRPEALYAKLAVVVLVFAIAFGFLMASLRHLGHFNLAIGSDPADMEELEGSTIDYLSTLISRASNRHTLGVRCFFFSLPLLLWIFHHWLFLGMTLGFAVKFIGFQDFRPFSRHRQPGRGELP